jgi:hypothetical protein
MFNYNPNEVNKKNTRTWVKLNEDSKSKANRDQFCKVYGGEFKQTGRYFQWEDLPQETEEKRIMVFEREGEIFEITNVMEFCREHNLTKSALYEVVTGKRKHHKKFKFVTKK